MKNYKKIATALLITFLVLFSKNNLSYSYKAQPTTEGGKNVCETAESLLAYMDENPTWKYNGNMPGKWKKNWEIAKPHKQSTCGTFVKWVFQESGYLKPDTTITHLSTSTATQKAFEKNTVNCTWYTPNKRLDSVKDQLLPGDCIIFRETIAIYAGYENGKYYVYNCISPDKFEKCIKARSACYVKYISKYNVLCVVRPGEGGQSSNLNSTADGNGGAGNSPSDNENDTFIGAMLNISRHILDSMITFFENYSWDRNDSTVMYDLNPDDNNYYGSGGAPSGDMVPEPNSSSIKKFSSTGGVPIQNFAITDFDSSPIVWLGCNPKGDEKYFTARIYKEATKDRLGNESGHVRLFKGGHQCFDVWKNGNSYNIYTGSYGPNKGKWVSKYNRWYYNPKGIAKSTIESLNGHGSSDLSRKGIRICSNRQHVNALGVDENTRKMVSVVSGRAIVWDLDITNFNNSKKTGKAYRVKSKELYQGCCLAGNYLYMIGGQYCDNMPIGCYDITTGNLVWYKTLDTKSTTGNYEPEGIKVYNYDGSNKIFIAFNRGGGIWYFDN